MRSRIATLLDAEPIARIYNQGIEDRVATFETRLRTAADIEKWFDGVHPIVVVESDGGVIAFAATSTYRPRECYAGIAEVSVYVDRGFRGVGAGRVATESIIHVARDAGLWKLVSRIFVENAVSRRLIAQCGFREVRVREARPAGWRVAGCSGCGTAD